jgi:hypothetical protein
VSDEPTSITGRCECGAVTYRVDGPVRDVFDCHCARCRRFTGHHMAGTSAPVERIAIQDDGTLTWYSPHPTVQYGFCGRCGSSLFWRAVERPDRLTITAGTIDQPTGLRTSAAWWMSEHGDYHAPHPGLIEHDRDG